MNEDLSKTGNLLNIVKVGIHSSIKVFTKILSWFASLKQRPLIVTTIISELRSQGKIIFESFHSPFKFFSITTFPEGKISFIKPFSRK